METAAIEQVLNSLQSKEIDSFRVGKSDFLSFRAVLVKREDFKHFRGIAEIGGDVTYKYLEEARS